VYFLKANIPIVYSAIAGTSTTSSSTTTPSATPTTTPASDPAFPNVGTYSYLGCQTEGTLTRALSAYMTAYDSMTLESCFADCKGYTYCTSPTPTLFLPTLTTASRHRIWTRMLLRQQLLRGFRTRPPRRMHVPLRRQRRRDLRCWPASLRLRNHRPHRRPSCSTDAVKSCCCWGL
jgi:hypothetical protein